jgi:hypothetical protein
MMIVSRAVAVVCIGLVTACASTADPNAPDETTKTSKSAIDPNDNWISIQFYNACPFPVQVGQMGAGDFMHLDPWQSGERSVGGDWERHEGLAYYAYHEGNNPGVENMTLAEFGFNTAWYNLDFYDVSNVNAFNMPMDIRPIGAGCDAARCAVDLLPGCPDGNRIWNQGWTISCTKWGDRDNPNNPAAIEFHNACPGAYSWSKDDGATRGCDAQDYIVTLCP